MARALVGTSGFAYKEWRPSFYPEGTAEKGFLRYYQSRFESVEIDGTFYRMPSAKTIAAWSAAVGEGFRFSVKASRRITHFGRLKVPSESLGYFQQTVAGLGSRLGSVLFQLPPNFKADLERLEAFLGALAPGIPSVFEFRHESWFADGTYDLLRRHGAALCIHDADEGMSPAIVTAPRIHVRLRRSAYPPETIAEWGARIRAWVGEGTDVLAYVKHEDNPDAPRIALDLADACR